MAKLDVSVLGAGIVGTCVALHLVKRGLAVALIDRRAPGEETSYGNAGIIEGNTIFPPAFPSDFRALLRIALKRAPEVNYHIRSLLQIAPWLIAFRAAGRPQRLIDMARTVRPLFARAIAEHEALIAESGAFRLLRKNGWLKLYRTRRAFDALEPERGLARELEVPFAVLDAAGVRELEPSLNPAFDAAVFWQGVASITDPLALTRAYAARFQSLGGLLICADCRSLHRSGLRWRVDTAQGPLDAPNAVVALGPFAPDLLAGLDIRLPLQVKRGYHRHFDVIGNARLSRPVVDIELGYCLAPMEQGIRLTTGAEFAERDAPPTPVQLERVLPFARELFPLGHARERMPWMGSRPCLPDSRPVIGPAPNHPGLWLAFGHAHWGLTLGAATGRLLGEMLAGATPFVDPAPYAASRFSRAAHRLLASRSTR